MKFIYIYIERCKYTNKYQILETVVQLFQKNACDFFMQEYFIMSNIYENVDIYLLCLYS